MALKIWNIGKANAEIDKLSAEVASLQAQLTAATSAVSENTSEAVKAAEGLQTELAAANTKYSKLEAEMQVLLSHSNRQAQEISDLTSKLVAKDAEVKIKVAEGAVNLQAKLGQPAAPAIPENATKTGTNGIRTNGKTLIESFRETLDQLGYQRKS